MFMPPRDEKAIFNAARQLDSPEARGDFIVQACGADANLRARVEALLRILEENRSFLQSPAEEVQAVLDDPIIEGPGTVIGPYRLIEPIGVGGFGVVFLAEQQQPIHRKVALKVIKPGMDTRQVVARFEAERQALALMDHPNIARVLDAGTTGEPSGVGRRFEDDDIRGLTPLGSPGLGSPGRPYFVMELVRGVPITDFCDQQRLSVQERLELFVTICQGVQHAHQKGIIHRDLKPSNVLVTLSDPPSPPLSKGGHGGVVKVIDFGIAKAMDQGLTDNTQLTGAAQMVGTPMYMSPEQAEMNRLDIDTRSDIYSLGVLLYELLTGATPFDKDRLHAAGLDEIRRMIREEEPPKPSTRLTTLGQAAGTASVNRQTDPGRLRQLVHGELDWIVMKALEKDRNRRYETAGAFAADVLRYLHDESVQACPPSTGYRLRKFVRRNKTAVLAASLLFVALAAGLAGTTWGMIHAEHARQDARAAERAEAERAQGERRAKEEAERRLAQVEQATDTLVSMIRDIDPNAAEMENVPLSVLLGRRLCETAQRFDGEAVGDPLVVARLQHVLGISLHQLGHLTEAETVLIKACQTRERLLGADDLDTVATKHHLGMLRRAQQKYPEAAALYTEVIAVRTAKLGADHPDTLTSRHEQALLYHSQGKLALAETSLQEVLALRSATLGAKHRDTLTTQHRLAATYRHLGKDGAAEASYHEVLAFRIAALGADHLDTLASKANLAVLYRAQGKFDKAEPLLHEVLAGRTAKLGADHPDTISSQGHLALLFHYQGQFGRAEAMYKEVMKRRTRRLEADHPVVLQCKVGLAALYRDQAQLAKAEAILQEVLALRMNRHGPDHDATHSSKHALAALYSSMGNIERSIPLFEEALQGRKAMLEPRHANILETQLALSADYCAAGKITEAIPLLEEVRAKVGDHRGLWLQAGDCLLTAYLRDGRTTEASDLLANHIQAKRQRYAGDGTRLALALSETGGALLAGKAYNEAEPLLRESLALAEAHAADVLDRHRIRSLLGVALVGRKKYAEAEPLLVQAFEGLDKTHAETSYAALIWRAQALERVVQLYVAWDKLDTAAEWRRKQEASPRTK